VALAIAIVKVRLVTLLH